MAASLSDPLERRGLLDRLAGWIGQGLQQCDRYLGEPATCLLGVGQPPVELLRPVHDHHLSMSLNSYNVKIVVARWGR